ncbi:MAG: tRNA guanosine(34) transglycosylase Tgt [Polyangiaceae bacterium]
MTPAAAGFAFRVVGVDGYARRAVLQTPHGIVETPTFMPVGTQGAVKTLSPVEVASTGARIVLGNTYHLMLRPGAEVLASMGGLREFCRWPHAMLTDSGGFQAYSLAASSSGPGAVGESEEGFTFRSHLDGSTRTLTPESAVGIQALLGADIQMQLDVCPPGDAPREAVARAVARTTRWARRALAVPRGPRQAIFGIVQGGCFGDLRREHADELSTLPFDGLALGGFSVGESNEKMHETLSEIAHALDPERPRYLMGVGTPRDLVLAIRAGVDMFDCVLPTRNARNGQAFTRNGRLVIKNSRWRDDPRPIDDRCGCVCCTEGFSRAYLRHLYMCGEILCLRLLSLHNLHFYGELMAGARDAISTGQFDVWARDTLFSMQANPAVA